MFLSNWLVFKIVLAAVTGLVDYPLAADVLLVYDNANKLYLSGGSLEYVSNVVLYKGETSYELGLGSILNKTTTTAYEIALPSNSVHTTFGINQDATRYVHQYPEASGYLNGKFQVYSGTPSDGYTEYGSPITPFNGNDIIYSSMSADGKYILVTGSTAEYKMYKDNGSEYVYHSIYSYVGSYTTSGYTPAFVPSNNNFVITGTGGGSNSGDFYFKLYVYDPLTETWTGKTTVYSLNAPTSDSQRGLWSKGFTYDGKYLLLGCNGTPSRGEVYEVDWDANTMVNVWYTTEGNDGDGAGGAISPDNRYVVLCRHTGNPYRVYENMSGDWSTVENVTSQFDLTGSGTSTSFGSYGVGFSGYSSNNTTPLYIGQAAGLYGDGKFRLEKWAKRSLYEIYITQPGTYRADLQICGIDYKTNEVEVTGSVTPVKSFPTTAQKLYPSDGGTVSDSDSYGYVGLSGNGLVMVVVGKGDDDTTADSGGFIVYEKINGVWTFTQQITNVGSGSDTFGLSEEGKAVQLDYTGTRVFIGAHADDHITTNTGSVYIYKRVAQGNWTLEQRIDGGAASYRYGYNDVNNDGDKLMIGSYGYPGSGNVGRVWYYTRSGTSWSLQDQLAAPSTSAYGNSVGINSTGTRAIIGGYTHSSNTGRVDIWNYSGSSWSIGAGFTGENASDNFGWNVDMSNDGNTVVVGAPLYSAGGTEGRVYIYTTSDGTNWSLLKTLSNQDANEWFGFSVQISGDGNTVVIGAGKNDEGLTNRGKSYVYVKSGGSWPSTPTYTILGTTANANNGYTLGISDTGETIISGAPFDDDKGSNQGAVYIFDKSVIAELTFDNYNKLSLTNTPTYTSSKLTYGSNVYDIGTLTSDITIEKQGEYASLTFDTSSNVAYFSNVTVGSLATNPLGNYRSVTKLDAGVQHSSFQEGTICFWAKALDTGPNYFSYFNNDRGFLQLTLQETYTHYASYGVINLFDSSKIQGYSGTSGNSVYVQFSTAGGAISSDYDPTKWNFYIFYTSTNGGTSRVYVPEFDFTATSTTYGRDHTYLRFDIDDDHVALTDVSVYTGNPGNTDSWRTTLYNGGQIGGAANESTNRVHYFRFHKDNLRDNEGTAATDISSSAEMSTSESLPGYSAAPSLTFDTYNKLSLSGITNPTSKLHALPTGAESTTTYDIGTATNIYIESEGTYTAEMKGSDAFALDSNTASLTTPSPNSQLYYPLTSQPSANIWSSTTDVSYGSDGVTFNSTSSTFGLEFTVPTSGIFTVSCNFMKTSFTSGVGVIIASSTNQNSPELESNFTATSYAWRSTNTGYVNTTGLTHYTNQWYHMVWVHDKNNGLTAYLDGVEVYSYSGTIGSPQTSFIVGPNYRSGTITNQFGAGAKMSDIRIYDTAISPTEAELIYRADNKYIPKLDFDTYNKLTFTGADTDSTYKLKYESNTYDLGTISNVYIAYPGTYSAEIKGATNFGLSSNITGSLGTYLTLHDNVAISHTTGGGQTLVTVNNIKGNKTYKISFNKQWTDSHASYSTRLKMYIKDSSDGSIRELASIGDYLNSPRDGILLYDAGGAFDESAMIVGTGFSVDGGAGSQTVEITGGTYGSTSSPFTLADPWYFLITMSTSDVITGKFFVGDTEVISHFLTRKQSGDTGTIGETGNKFVFEFHSTATISGVNMTVEEYNPAPKLDFDGYNKLTFSGLESGSTSTLKYGSNTYSIGTASNVYISEQGTYEAESKGTTTFALTKNVVGAINTDFPKPEGNVWDFTTTSSLTEPFYNSSLTKTGTMTHSGTYYETPGTTANQYLEFTFPTLTNNVLVQFEAYTGSARTSPFRFSDMFEFYKANNDYWRFLSAGGNYSDILRISGVSPAHSAWGKYSYFFEKTSSTQFTMYYYANGVKQTIYSESATGHTLSNGGIVFPISDINDAPYMRFGAMNQNSSSTNRFSNVYIEMEQLSGRVLTTDLIGTPDWFGFSIPPSLTHDGYKLVVKNITPTSSTLKYESNTYEIGTATNIYVENTGDYSAEIGNATDFVLTNTTVSGTIKTVEPGFASRYQGSMALTYDGKLYAWGMNDDGEAGVGTPSDITVPTLCTGITQGTVAKLLSGSDITDNSRGEVSYVKTIDGKIYATGKGVNFVIPGTTSDLTSFTDVTSYFGDQSLTANNVTMMSFTQLSGAALTETGNVWTWGTHDSTNKALGQASASSSSTPKQINFSSATGTITKVTCGSVHSLALDSSGDVWFWGKNTINSDSWPSSVTDEPQKVVDGKNIIGLASSYGTMYAWDATGKMWNAGNNWEGQIGDGTTTTNTTGKTLTEVTYFSSNGITINKVYGGGYFVFADTSDGYYCWGAGTHGVFGNGSTGNITSGPAKWTNVSNIKKFMASTQHTTAITEDGKYYAWGRDYHGSRGDSDSSSDITYPKYIDTLPNILAPSFEFDGYDKILLPNKAVKWIPLLASDANTHDQYIRGGNADSSTNGYWYNPDGSQRTNGPELKWDDTVGSWILDSTTFSFNCRINKKNGTWSLSHDHEPGTQHGSSYTHDDVVLQQDTTEVWITTNGGAYIRHRWKAYFEEPYNYENTKYTKDTHTYDANQAQIVTVSDPGTYDAQIKDPENFALKSATIPATSSTGLYTWAFHHGNFDNAYGDGDILTARDNGRFYADTPSYTGDIGTITPVNPFGTTQPTLVSSLTITNGKALNTLSYSSYVHRSTDTTNTRYVYALGTLSEDTKYDIAYNWVTKKWLDIDSDATHNTFGTSASDTTNTSRISTENPQTVYVMETYWNLLFAIFTNPYYQESVSSTTYTFTPASTLTANVLMVAGGGGGGGRYTCGGGGAGGLVYTAATTLSGTKTIVVGNGDSGGNGNGQSGYNGKDTTFTELTPADGGGYGGTQGTAGGTGGSGGGGGGQTGNGTGGSGTANQGNAGGTGSSSGTFGAGGGGGSDTAGSNGSSGVGGSGGSGKFFGTGSSYTDFGDEYGEGGYFAGGGGGGTGGNAANTPGTPGRGGGGYGATYYGYMGINDSSYGGSQHALPHTGGGGGGSGVPNDRDQHPGYASINDGGVMGHGGRGGSGIVLIQTNIALPNGANTAVVQVGNPRRRSLPPAVSYMGSEVNRFSIIDSASMPTYKLPTHWYVDPNGYNGNSVFSTQGSHSLQKRADGGTSNVFYVTSTEGIFEYGSYMAQSADAIFMPVEAQRYNGLLAIGSNSTNDIHFEMAADGTAALYYDNGATLLSAGTITCFTVGKWHHIALTVDSGGNAVGYVNGYPVVSGTHTSVAAVGSRSGNMHMRVGDHSITFRKFLTYEVSTYNFHMSPKQVLQRAAEVGLGPKLEYDGLNAINVVNTEPGSGTEITIYESNVNDTSNLYVVSCNESSYLLSNAGTYYAQIKGTDTFTITRPLTVTDDHFPLYQYPPVVTGTKSSLTTSLSADTWNTWTMSGASTGNGQYQVKTSHATNAPGGTHATAASLFTNGVKIEIISDGGASIYSFLHTSQLTNFDITLQLPSAKIIRKYVLYPADAAPVSTPGGSVDPTLPGNGGEHNTRRPKSWVLKGSNDDTSWTTIHTVTNQPPSIYGDVHSISSPASYQYYQLSISANNGSSQFLILGEWQLWGDA